MKLKISLCLLAMFSTAGIAWGQPGSDPVGELVREGQDAVYRMDFPRAIRAFTGITELEPESPVGYGMMALARWAIMIDRASNPALQPYGAPNPYVSSRIPADIGEQQQRFREANDRLLEVAERALGRDPDDVTALYFKGLHYENLAAEAIVIAEDKRAAVGPGLEAKGLHERVLELDPGFVDARVSVAAYEYALATVDGFAGIVLALPRLFGFFRGDLGAAFRMMEEVAREGRFRGLDGSIVLAMMHAWEGDPARAVSILESLGRRYPENYRLDLTRAAIVEHRLDDGEGALEAYGALLEALDSKHPGLGEAEVHFRIGRTFLALDRGAEATEAFRRAIASPAVEAETHPLSRYHRARIAQDAGMARAARAMYREFLDGAASIGSLEPEVEDARDRLRSIDSP